MNEELLGVEVDFISSFCDPNEIVYHKRTVVGIDPVKGITLVDINDTNLKLCVTPNYFGPKYEEAYSKTVEMIKKGVVNGLELRELIIPKIRDNDGGVFFGTHTVCPYE